MSLIKSIIRFYAEEETWICAIRKRTDKLLYEGNFSPFTIIPNSKEYWRADPFIYKYQDKNYLFCEMFDRKARKGVIGVAIVDNNGTPGDFKTCLNLSSHLSYPCIFERNGEIYMIPENSASGKAVEYKAVSFPYEWKEHRIIAHVAACDTTPIIGNDGNIENYLYSLFNKKSNGCDNLNLLNSNGESTVLSLNDCKVRPAGHLIPLGNNTFLKPTQDDEGTYGCALYFNNITFQNSVYKETVGMRIIAPDTKQKDGDRKLKVTCKKRRRLVGVHTYNSNEDFEVVDFVFNNNPDKYILRHNIKNIVRHAKSFIKNVK